LYFRDRVDVLNNLFTKLKGDCGTEGVALQSSHTDTGSLELEATRERFILRRSCRPTKGRVIEKATSSLMGMHVGLGYLQHA
jgi:hypothetical protein